MDLKDYFENNKGLGVLATADGDGQVDAAIYARPHAMEDGTVAMIMADRLSHANLQTNPRATYLFKEEGPGYQGKRLFLTRVREESDSETLRQLRRRSYPAEEEAKVGPLFLVYFKVDKELPLLGEGPAE